MDKDCDKPHGKVELKRRFWRRCIYFAGGGVILPPVIGAVGTMIAMRGAFEALSETGTSSEVGILNKQIGAALMSSGIGIFIAAPALAFLIISLIRYFTLPKKRSDSFPPSQKRPV